MTFENIVGKGENAHNQNFPLFPSYCLTYQGPLLSICLSLSCADAFNLGQSNGVCLFFL